MIELSTLKIPKVSGGVAEYSRLVGAGDGD